MFLRIQKAITIKEKKIDKLYLHKIKNSSDYSVKEVNKQAANWETIFIKHLIKDLYSEYRIIY